MNVFRGQIWFDSKNDRYLFVCGVSDDNWVYYTYIDKIYYGNKDLPWTKAKIENFTKHFSFTHTAISPKGYWKAKATKVIVQIIAVKDNGINKVYVIAEFDQFPIYDFYRYFEPCSKVEYLLAIAREKQENKYINEKQDRIKRKIKMLPGRYIDPL